MSLKPGNARTSYNYQMMSGAYLKETNAAYTFHDDFSDNILAFSLAGFISLLESLEDETTEISVASVYKDTARFVHNALDQLHHLPTVATNVAHGYRGDTVVRLLDMNVHSQKFCHFHGSYDLHPLGAEEISILPGR